MLTGKSKTIQVEPVEVPATVPEPEEVPAAEVEAEAAEAEVAA